MLELIKESAFKTAQKLDPNDAEKLAKFVEIELDKIESKDKYLSVDGTIINLGMLIVQICTLACYIWFEKNTKEKNSGTDKDRLIRLSSTIKNELSEKKYELNSKKVTEVNHIVEIVSEVVISISDEDQ